ncbi:hypothetical protein LXL04_023786 [Taraxacum kok-saghyz]
MTFCRDLAEELNQRLFLIKLCARQPPDQILDSGDESRRSGCHAQVESTHMHRGIMVRNDEELAADGDEAPMADFEANEHVEEQLYEYQIDPTHQAPDQNNPQKPSRVFLELIYLRKPEKSQTVNFFKKPTSGGGGGGGGLKIA